MCWNKVIRIDKFELLTLVVVQHKNLDKPKIQA